MSSWIDMNRSGREMRDFQPEDITNAPSKALAQLQAKGYADKYKAPGVNITLIGIEFSRENKNIVAFESCQA